MLPPKDVLFHAVVVQADPVSRTPAARENGSPRALTGETEQAACQSLLRLRGLAFGFDPASDLAAFVRGLIRSYTPASRAFCMSQVRSSSVESSQSGYNSRDRRGACLLQRVAISALPVLLVRQDGRAAGGHTSLIAVPVHVKRLERFDAVRGAEIRIAPRTVGYRSTKTSSRSKVSSSSSLICTASSCA